MIIAERKPFAEIKAMLAPYKKILIVGCGTCVAVCLAGGEKEVGLLASQLRLALGLADKRLEIGEITVERQCDLEFLRPLCDFTADYDAIVSMACGAGVQFLNQLCSLHPVFPAVNTTFIGVNNAAGYYTEACRACHNCYLGITGGICPVSRCAKRVMNGPCGGSTKGKCEISKDVDCAWQLIVDRLKALNKMDDYEIVAPIKDWSTDRAGGPRKVTREDVKI